ncbi:hypothetical protein FJY94_03500 [Candidatus Kaiserbacteria bacterium]|nr:hypothetical protein [Candidatus Kaiserbacteria bacterium]
MKVLMLRFVVVVAACASLVFTGFAADLNYTVSWVENSFPGASNKGVQNFYMHTNVQPDGSKKERYDGVGFIVVPFAAIRTPQSITPTRG